MIFERWLRAIRTALAGGQPDLVLELHSEIVDAALCPRGSTTETLILGTRACGGGLTQRRSYSCGISAFFVPDLATKHRAYLRERCASVGDVAQLRLVIERLEVLTPRCTDKAIDVTARLVAAACRHSRLPRNGPQIAAEMQGWTSALRRHASVR